MQYFGTERKWTAPKNRCGCFSVPDELKAFVSDYRINVFEIAWLEDAKALTAEQISAVLHPAESEPAMN